MNITEFLAMNKSAIVQLYGNINVLVLCLKLVSMYKDFKACMGNKYIVITFI